tara:strand:+ start:235 stop:1092 length:858 start_codon:yes stop_codon:yes gene_type:complete
MEMFDGNGEASGPIVEANQRMANGFASIENFTYPGQIFEESGLESLYNFTERIKGKYIAEKILVENPRAKIAIYGDSFAAVGENSQSNRIPDHESKTWIYFLANILEVECHSYGVSCSGEGDISHYVHKTLDRDDYDYVIIFHTDPTRPSRYCPDEHSFKNCKRMLGDLKNYNALHVYWDEYHQVFNYSDDEGKETFVSNYHLTNPNNPPDFVHEHWVKDTEDSNKVVSTALNPEIQAKTCIVVEPSQNPLDNQYGIRPCGINHMSERGNLRFAVEISKIIDKYL